MAIVWDIPGQRPDDRFGAADPLPDVGPEVAALMVQLQAVAAVDPTRLTREQALVDTEALLRAAESLRIHNLTRLADVHGRRLQDLTDKRTASAWIEHTSPDTERGELLLGRRLRQLPVLAGALEERAISVGSARKVALALATLRRHVDRPDGLIDGQPGAEVVPAVVRHVVDQIAHSRLGLRADSEELPALAAEVERILTEGGSDLQQLERAFTVMASHVPANRVRDALGELTDALLPNLLEDKARRGEDVAGLSLTPKSDGSGWDLHGDLDLETGELLFAALGAETRRDEENGTTPPTLRRCARRARSPMTMMSGRCRCRCAGPGGERDACTTRCGCCFSATLQQTWPVRTTSNRCGSV